MYVNPTAPRPDIPIRDAKSAGKAGKDGEFERALEEVFGADAVSFEKAAVENEDQQRRKKHQHKPEDKQAQSGDKEGPLDIKV